MTNHTIIENAKQDLARAGIIAYTGRTLRFELEDGSEIEMPETEEIHTFSAWKSLGYAVRRGEHAVAHIRIWKCATRPADDEAAEGSETDTRMFMKTAFFFSQRQVERVA